MESAEVIFQDINVLGESRDALYTRTNTFTFKSDDDFVIVYGVNHTKSGKAIYYNTCLYGEEKVNGVSVIYSSDCPGSAAPYFPKNCNDSDQYFVYIFARKGKGNNVSIVPYCTGNPKGCCYGVDNNQEIFVGFREYLDQKTLIGPAPYDIIWNQAILFRKKKRTTR